MPPRTAIQRGWSAATDSAGARMARGRVRGGGGGDQVGRAGEGEIGRDLGGAGDDAAGDGEEFDSGGGDQDVVGVVEGLEKGERGGGKFGIERRGAEAIEIDSGERDGGGGHAGG